jgi:hypothetical protein
LDATALNPEAVRLTNGSGSGTRIARAGGHLHWAVADLNGDGLLDVSAGFRRADLIANGDLTANTIELILIGELGSCGDVIGRVVVRVRRGPKTLTDDGQGWIVQSGRSGNVIVHTNVCHAVVHGRGKEPGGNCDKRGQSSQARQ